MVVKQTLCGSLDSAFAAFPWARKAQLIPEKYAYFCQNEYVPFSGLKRSSAVNLPPSGQLDFGNSALVSVSDRLDIKWQQFLGYL